MSYFPERKLIEVLKILSEQREAIGARMVAKQLSERGYKLDERTVRYHMRILDERGLTKNLGYDGRMITSKGLEEIKNALPSDRMGFIITKIGSLIFNMDFDVKTGKGKVIVNLAVIDKGNLKKVLSIIRRVIKSGFAVCPRIRIFDEGEKFNQYTVPKGKAILATLCSITLDGILHKVGVPVTPKLGGVLQFLNGEPKRFTEAICYTGSTLDPLDLFAMKGLSSVLKVVETGNGHVLANLREIPMNAIHKARECLHEANKYEIDGMLKIGEPNEPVFEMPVGTNLSGIALIGGTNPLAAVNEKGIAIGTKAIEQLIDFGSLIHIDDI
ncbi:MAG: NrpR regulatory domain-containing protein [Candidatus Bathyarchaeota archaeon]